MKHKQMTVFLKRYQKSGSYLTELSQWTEDIRSGRYAEQVTRMRQLRAEGKNDEADRVKADLPALVTAGDCMAGRHIARLTNRTGIAMFDQDHMPPDLLRQAFEVLKQQPWVAGGHVTSSGEGLRTFVQMGEVHPDVYRRAYETVAAAITRLTGFPCDPATSDLCRFTYTSYDPEAYCREDAECFPYPEEANPFTYVPASGDDASEDFRNLAAACPPAEPENASGNVPQGPETAGRADVPSVLARFFRHRSFTRGCRHTLLLRLGQYARRSGLSREGVESLKREVFNRYGELPFKEYDQAVEWGYTHAEITDFRKGQGSQGSYEPSPRAKEGIESDEEEVMSRCPFFPDWIFEGLPSLLRRGLAAARTPRERDMLLMAMLANLSACMPGLKILYARREYSPHLYYAAIAPAGSGKGVVSLAAALGELVNRDMLEENRKRVKELHKEEYRWEVEKKKALQEKRSPDWDLQPGEYHRKLFCLPPNVSKSQFMLDLEASGDVGLVCNCSEIDAFTAAISTDYGKHAAELRMIFHHETVGQDYKTDGRSIVIRRPRLALCLSGTLQQLVNFVSTKEDGMYSRLALLTGEGSTEWLSAAPEEEEAMDAGALFDGLAVEVRELFRFSLRAPVRVRFTTSQWKRHDRLFGSRLRSVSLEEGEGNAAIVGRHGLIAARIAAVICGLRRYEGGFAVEEYVCADEDFDTALALTRVLLEHSLALSTILPDLQNKRNAMSAFFRIRTLLDDLPECFTYSAYAQSVRASGLSESSAKRVLKKLLKRNMVTKEEGIYRKLIARGEGSYEPCEP